MNETAYDRLIGALRQYGYRLRDSGRRAESQCPAHPDRQASMSITGIEGQVLVHCHAGCETPDIVAAVDLTMADLYDDKKGATYRYASGRVVHRSVDKKFYQTGDTKIVELYRAERLDGLDKDQIVYLVEGEKDVHAVEAVGAVAVTAPQGSNNFGKVNVQPLRDRHVIAVIDRPKNENDRSGQIWAADVHAKLDGVAASLRYVQAAVGKDAADHIAAGLDLAALESADPPTAANTPRRHAVGLDVPRTARTTRWVWGQDNTGWMPRGTLTLLAGREGGGKSTVLAWLAARITRGELPGVYHGQPRHVLYAATEDSWEETISPRMIAAGADLDLIKRVAVVTEDGQTAKLNLPVDTHTLPQLAASFTPGVAVLMLDPVLSFIDDNISTNRAQELRTALEPLVRAAEDARMSVIGLVHFNKSTEVDVNSMIAGSRAWVEVARSVLACAWDDDGDRYVLSQTKNSRGRKMEAMTYTLQDAVVEGVDDEDQPADVHVGRVVWGEAADTDAETLLQRRPGNRGGVPRDQPTAAERVLQFLAGRLDRGWPPGEIGRQTGVAEGSVRRALHSLRDRGTVRLHHGLYFLADPTDERQIGDDR